VAQVPRSDSELTWEILADVDELSFLNHIRIVRHSIGFLHCGHALLRLRNQRIVGLTRQQASRRRLMRVIDSRQGNGSKLSWWPRAG
jgi:hypothetical protein